MKSFTKGFAPILVIIIATGILALAGGGYWWWQNKTKVAVPVVSQQQTTSSKQVVADATASWKTYINTRNGYQLKYPADWQTEENLGVSVRIFNPRAQGKPDTDQPSEALSLAFKQTTCKASNWDVGFGLANYKTACIATNPMIHVDMVAFSDQTKKIEDQILSSFANISTVQTPDSQTANWKTYRNEKYGFEFRYPQGLDFQSLTDTNAVQTEVKSGLPNDPHVNSVRMSIGADNTKSSSESCMPNVYPSRLGESKNVAEHAQAGSNLFYKYYDPNFVGCGGFQCDGGQLYTIWHNNTCYQLKYSYSADYLEKMFSCSVPGSNGFSESCIDKSDYPKYVAAKQSQKAAYEYIDNLAKQILSTFKFTK